MVNKLIFYEQKITLDLGEGTPKGFLKNLFFAGDCSFAIRSADSARDKISLLMPCF
jgi:hypothetical protein